MKAFRFTVLLSLFLLSGCGGAGLRGSVYRGDGIAFRIGELPPTWQHVDVTNARLAFRDDAGESTVLVNGRCGHDGDDVPLAALMQHLFISFTERVHLVQETIPLDGREAMHTVMRAKLDGVPKVFDAYVLKKDGCVYDLVGIFAVDTFERGRAPFERFATGFHVISANESRPRETTAGSPSENLAARRHQRY